jgi:hypothetical protein
MDERDDRSGPRATKRVLRWSSSALGTVLAGATRAIAAIRPAAKPLHPNGAVLSGRVRRQGSNPPSGSSWVDEPGQDLVAVRISRAIGLPDALPDIHGLALRVLLPRGHGDLLFASTGRGRVSRFVLTFGRRAGARPMTTLLPYRTSGGPVLLAVRETGPHTFELSWSRLSGEWRPFAELRLFEDVAEDQEISFDPVRHQLPGLDQYPWVVRLREPAYFNARRSRR